MNMKGSKKTSTQEQNPSLRGLTPARPWSARDKERLAKQTQQLQQAIVQGNRDLAESVRNAPPFKDRQEAAAFDAERYERVKALLTKAFELFEGQDAPEAALTLLRNLRSQGVPMSAIREMTPYITRFMEENFVESGDSKRTKHLVATKNINDSKTNSTREQSSPSKASIRFAPRTPEQIAESEQVAQQICEAITEGNRRLAESVRNAPPFKDRQKD